MERANYILTQTNCKYCSEILHANEEIVLFNAQKIDENSAILKSGVSAKSATAESNKTLIASNSTRVDAIAVKAAENKAKITTVLASAEANRQKISLNTDVILERRVRIQENAKKIKTNQVRGRIFTKICIHHSCI